MPRQFVPTPNGYIDLNEISYVHEKRNGRFEIGKSSGIYADNFPFDQLIVEHLPAPNDLECLFYDDTSGSYWSEPVVAFGRTILGHLIPVTLGNMEGVFQDHAMRKAGSPQVFTENANYRDVVEWLADYSEASKRHSASGK